MGFRLEIYLYLYLSISISISIYMYIHITYFSAGSQVFQVTYSSRLHWLYALVVTAPGCAQVMSVEVADLVDKLGRAVLQRDENLREKSKAQAGLGVGFLNNS